MIKLDVEGAEGLVIDGGWSTIVMNRPIVVSEFSPEMLGRVSKLRALDYLNRFLNEGYRIFLLERGKTDGVGAHFINTASSIDGYGHNTRIEDLALLPD